MSEKEKKSGCVLPAQCGGPSFSLARETAGARRLAGELARLNGRRVRSRIAPTPSGLLHLGNALNFVLTWVATRAVNGTLRLRIDDADRGRCRQEFVEDILRQLGWLGLDWDEGPSGVADFFRRHSQLHRLDRYRRVLRRLQEEGAVYPCSCSRRQIRQRSSTGLYPGTCRLRPPPTEGGSRFAWRVALPQECWVAVDGVRLALPQAMGDFVLWRKDDLPAYQLASLVDDLDHRISFVVRGEDLLPSSAAQLFLARLLGEDGGVFCSAAFFHHPLITGPANEKLSKSKGALTLAAMRQAGAGPEAVYRLAASFLDLPLAAASGPASLAEAWRAKLTATKHSTPNGR